MRLILASNNAHKAREFREILAPLGTHPVDVAGHAFVLDDVVLRQDLAAELRCEVGGAYHEKEHEGDSCGEQFRGRGIRKIHVSVLNQWPKVRKNSDSPSPDGEK